MADVSDAAGPTSAEAEADTTARPLPQGDVDMTGAAEMEPQSSPAAERSLLPQKRATRSSVRSKAPAISAVDGDDAYAPTRKRKKPASERRPKREKKDIWAEEHLLQDPNSPLVTCNLRDVLAHPTAWDVLSPDERRALIALLPAPVADAIDSAALDPSPGFLLQYDAPFRSSVARFQDDLAAGRFDPVWLADAHRASRQRAAGAFDAFKQAEFERFWGQKQTTSFDAQAAKASLVRFEELCAADQLRPGDVLLYRRALQRREKRRKTPITLTVEKEITLIATRGSSSADAVFAATVSYPPGTHPMSSPHLRDDVVRDVAGPDSLEAAVVAAHGGWPADAKIPGGKAGDAWRFFRVRRDNQDIGSLWDMRVQVYAMGIEPPTDGHGEQTKESQQQ